MIRLTILENRFETDLITRALAEDGIAYLIKRYEDSAYDGLFVTQKGYAALYVEETDKEAAEAVVETVRVGVETDAG